MKKLSLLVILNSYRLYFRVLFLLLPGLAPRKAVKVFSTPFSKKIRRKEVEILSQAEKSTYPYAGLPIHMYSWGSGDKKALLVHGWEGNAGNLGAFVEDLIEKGYQVIAFDGPAHGKSGGKQTNLFHFGGLVAELIEAHKPDLLLTHSFGSAASILALHSGKELSIRKMVMLTSPDRLEDIFSDFTRLMKISDKGKAGIFDYIEKRFGKRVEEMNVSSLAQDCKIEELLIVHPTTDKILSFQGAERVAAKLPQARLEAPTDTGHYRMLWDMKIIETVQQFIHA